MQEKFLRRCRRVLAGATVAVVASCGSSGVPGVSVRSPTTTDLAQLVEAFNSWELLPPTCRAEIIRSSVRVATIDSSGVSWAMAAFRHGPHCTSTAKNSAHTTIEVPIDQIGPWGRIPQPPIGIFQRSPGAAAWQMNDEGGHPFPCPGPGGTPPSPGNGALPAPVLAAWHLKYATNCANVVYPMRPED